MKSEREIEEILEQHICTENYYRHISGLQYTDGVKALATECEAYWLLDLISTNEFFSNTYWDIFRTDRNVKNSDFQNEIDAEIGKNEIIIICHDGNYNVYKTYKIKNSDFPLSQASIWVLDDVMIIPSEY